MTPGANMQSKFPLIKTVLVSDLIPYARLMELDPKYCDVIIKRWQDFTGKQATLESTGQTFQELTNARLP